MSDTESTANGRVPTLVQLCQRVASSCVDSVTTFGDDLSYPLVKPILERCTAGQLLVLEESSPHLLEDTLEIWMQLCIRKYPTAVEKYLDDDLLEPTSWRERYKVLEREEQRRFERLGSKLKAQRMEAEERKKEREVKLTDRVPPPKRARTWGAPVPQRTLMQKTFSEASKIQKAMYHSRMIPPMNNGKTYRVLTKPACNIMPASTPADSNRVSVNTVQKRASSNCSAPPRTSPPSSSTLQTSSARTQLSDKPRPNVGSVASPTSPSASSPVPRQSGSTPLKRLPAASPGASPDARSIKPMAPVRKDPMASLFVPKHRAYSQRPV
ncbi:hypothetical protein NP233_g11294 [Leucocoprinus birnbaumii]|uniref:Elongin-A n=1 Tax=Leucocoprinus birnbaumii TaxID=56174 RepID=A0AAD5VMS8_9AGAR|nr:hypothetical protein NP233_g11294 [Leucocoprinus birnbaumii]